MAERVDKFANPNYVPTEFGFYNEVIDNYTNIVSDCFRLSDENIRSLAPVKIYKMNPKGFCLEDLPSLFIWISGSEPDYPEFGTGNANKSKTLRRKTYLNFQYVFGMREVEANEEDLRWIAHVLEEWLLQNMNGNDIVNGWTEFEGTAFGVEPRLTRSGRDETLCLALVVEIRISIMTQTKIVPSRR